MPKAKPLSLYPMKLKDALKRTLNTPPLPKSQKARQAAKRPKPR